jgi:hypothetical protein
MSLRPHGRATVDPYAPKAWGTCDRCGTLYNHRDLQWQYEWAGQSMFNKRLLVCEGCSDVPNDQLRTIFVQPDPEPVLDARPMPYAQYEDDI